MSLVYSHAVKYSEGEVRRNQEVDSNNIGYPQQHCHQYNSGLLRYNSAPTSLLKSLVDEEGFRSEEHQHQSHPPSTSSEMETMLAKLISSNSEPLQEVGGNTVKQEMNPVSQGTKHHNGYSYVSPSQLVYQPQQTQGLPNGSLGVDGNSFDGSFSGVRSMASENYTQNKMGSSNCSNLIRQKSSPAGFFSVDNGLAALREVGSFRASAVSNGHATTSSSGLHGTFNFSSRPSSCSTRMPQIAENEHEGLQANYVERRNIGNDNGNTKPYMPSYLWDGSAFNASKTATNNGEIMFSTTNLLETMDAEFGNQKLLSHQLSLPSSSTKMDSMDKFLQIQGSVLCKIRAKRGFATHPRSIAERERRTRISSRIKKLQGLFPQSDKQTSTADLLDLTTEYIKGLQKQVQVLTEAKAKCTCTSN